jgi:hypothetical protein
VKTVPTGELAPKAIRSTYPHLTAAPRLLEFYVPGSGWRSSGPDVYATETTIRGLRRIQHATMVAVAIAPNRTADFTVAEVLS